jgi:hypothetical protein
MTEAISPVYTTPDRVLQDFVSRGLIVLSPESLGVPADIHRTIFEKEQTAFKSGNRVSAAGIPEILEVLNSKGLVSACNQLLGENWAIVPFTHNTPFLSGASDQHWHKDDNGPFNGRKQRHHQAVQIEMLYYPQLVSQDMGPTATIPYSHYWTFNHEENHDNFAGADHLDFAYQLDGMEREPVSGPRSSYSREDIVNRRTKHDIRMRDAVTNLGWPLVKPFEAAPLSAGSIVLYSHNLFHRGNHRRDEFENWKQHPRFMWRFWLYRTTEPGVTSSQDWQQDGTDTLTNTNLSQIPEDVSEIWRYHYQWIQTGQSPAPRTSALNLSADQRQQEAEALYLQLLDKGESAEPARLGAAYKLASIGDTDLANQVLAKALYHERESVRRAAGYGLAAVGPGATSVLVEATRSPVRWIRKAGIFGLGECGEITDGVIDVLAKHLQHDSSVYVRSVAAGSLGCLGRRSAVTTGAGTVIARCLDALMASLAVEENRLGMDKAQNRSIKFVRPTDESDVCEGIGIDYGVVRFEPVRSAVRENALWSVVILCTHAALLDKATLTNIIRSLRSVVEQDKNVFCVGFATDALNRIANLSSPQSTVAIELRGQMDEILGDLPIRSWEPLIRGGTKTTRAAEFESSR